MQFSDPCMQIVMVSRTLDYTLIVVKSSKVLDPVSRILINIRLH